MQAAAQRATRDLARDDNLAGEGAELARWEAEGGAPGPRIHHTAASSGPSSMRSAMSRRPAPRPFQMSTTHVNVCRGDRDGRRLQLGAWSAACYTPSSARGDREFGPGGIILALGNARSRQADPHHG